MSSENKLYKPHVNFSIVDDISGLMMLTAYFNCKGKGLGGNSVFLEVQHLYHHTDYGIGTNTHTVS